MKVSISCIVIISMYIHGRFIERERYFLSAVVKAGQQWVVCRRRIRFYRYIFLPWNKKICSRINPSKSLGTAVADSKGPKFVLDPLVWIVLEIGVTSS